MWRYNSLVRLMLWMGLVAWIPAMLFYLGPNSITRGSFIASTINRQINVALDKLVIPRIKQDAFGSNKAGLLLASPGNAPVVALVTAQEVLTSNSTKNILVISPVHWLFDWVGKSRWESSEVFKACPVSNCYLTGNKGVIDKVDAVLFRARDLNVCRNKTKPGQTWVIFEHESPMSFNRKKLSNKCHKNLFNWTMIFRRDSDFVLAHGQFSKSTGYDKDTLDTLIRNKTKSVVGFISHCHAYSERDEYIRKLRSYGVKIDIFGACGNLKCVRGSRWKSVWNSSLSVKNNCFDVLDNDYKFYLSFENALCVDYVTEKSLHLVLRHNIIPIIRDASNRALFHPPKSYLDTKDFKDVASLAARIQELESNLTEYTDYLTWRKHYSVETVAGVLQTEFCNMCQRLHNPEKYHRVYEDVGQFIMTRGNGSPNCHKATDIK